jgi:hypothetical protein
MSDFMPRAKPPPRSDYPVEGPFIMVRGSFFGKPVILPGLTFEEAITEFVRYGIEPNDADYGCGVLDRDGVIVIAWHPDRENGGYEWVGVLAALDELRQREIVSRLILIDIESDVLK